MDNKKSSSNRTDLLAAGKKRLLQFRQKKDNMGRDRKGKDSRANKNSTGKADESDHHDEEGDVSADVDIVTTKSSQLLRQEVELQDESSSFVPASAESSIDGSLDSRNADTLLQSTPYVEPEGKGKEAVACDEKLSLEDSKAAVTSLTDELGTSIENQEDVVPGTNDVQDVTPQLPVNSNGSSVSESGGDVSAYTEGQQKEAQVSDEAEDLGSKEYDGGPELDTRQKDGFSESANNVVAESNVLCQVTTDAQGTYDSVQNTTESQVSSSATDLKDGDHELDKAGSPSQVMQVAIEKVSEAPNELHQGNEYMVPGCSDEAASCLPLVSGDYGQHLNEQGRGISILDEGNKSRYLVDGLNASASFTDESVRESETENLACENTVSYAMHEVSNSLSQLGEVQKGQPPDELWSRGAVVLCGLTAPVNYVADFPQRFKEQLYLASILRDLYLLQLFEQSEEQVVSDREHHNMVDEISMLNVSLLDVQELNKNLNVELTQCKTELQDAMRAKEELHGLLQSANEQENQSSGALDELKKQLADCKNLLAGSHAENDTLLKNISSLTDEKNKMVEVNEHFIVENKGLSASLVDYQNSLTALQAEISNLNAKINFAASQEKKLEEENIYYVRQNENLSENLAEYKLMLASLQEENTRLNMSLASEMDNCKKLLEDKEFHVLESERLSTEIAGCQDKLTSEHNQRMQLADDFNNVTMQLDGLIEEKYFLHNNLGIFKTTLIDLDSRQRQLLSEDAEAGNQGGSHPIAAGVSDSHRSPLNQLDVPYRTFCEPVSGTFGGRPYVKESDVDVSDDSGFVTLRRHLKEAEIAMQELEKAVDGMNSYSASLSRSVDKGAIPHVSKLIQAFESKAIFDDHDSRRTLSTESQMPHDPYLSAKEEVQKLRGVLDAISEDAEYASYLYHMTKDGSISANVAIAELEEEMRILKDYCSTLELRSIELDVLYAAFEQHAYSTEAEKINLETLFESLKGQEAGQRSEKIKLGKKVADCHRRISELQYKLIELRSSTDFTAEVFSQMEYLQKHMVEYVIAAEGGWNSTLSRIVQLSQKLDAAVGKTLASPDTGNGDTSVILDHISTSVDAASEEIQSLKGRIEATSSEHVALSGLYEDTVQKYDALHAENERTTGLLKRISGGLVSALNNFPGVVAKVENQKRQYSHHDPFDADQNKVLIEEVSSLLSEAGQLKELNSNLHAELLDRTSAIEELKKKSVDPHDILTLVQDVIEVQDAKAKGEEPPLQHLQSSVSLLVHKYREALKDASLLRGDIKCKMLELGELQGQFDQLKSFNLQLQNEAVIFKESLIQAKDAYDAVRGELKEKTMELEQSEQRVASVREKLGIAVAKGKGLVVQRDSLKQSLAETSSELERCSQELRLKDSRIFELEEKLKAYSEAGERMEALESELSYIRNSATALRESFLLKDATLQRIEEILEDLELSEHFHSKGVIEKVDWLAKSVSGNSMPPVDWDQRSFVGGGSPSDTGFETTDAWKEVGQPSAIPVDDLRRKFDELQTKFYELAEQNDMLEQSLVERNNLVQRWEEVLDRINTPPQLRAMEPEERIEWLGCALSEADNHLRSLQQKIDQYENYSGLLSADLEETQRSASSLESSLKEVICEKEELSERLEVITSNHAKNLVNNDLLEHEADRLRNEVDDLGKKMAEKLQYEEQIRHVEGEISRLQDLIADAVSVSGSEIVVSDGNGIKCLELLLRKLIEDYRRGSAENSETTLPEHGANLNERHGREAGIMQIAEHNNSDVGEKSSIHTVVDKEEIVGEMRKELETMRSELMQLKGEREEFMEKCRSLTNDMEALAKEKTDLQEQVSQGEKKSASLREKLNVAVRKGKSLVQQRDSLKQGFDDVAAEVGRLKSELSLREDIILDLEKKISDMTDVLERHKALESESLFLKNQLMEVKQVVEEREITLNLLWNKIDEISFAGLEVNDPVLKLDGIKRMYSDLHATVASSQQETMKSKRAAELLLAELNEVQERNDGLQEEIGRVYAEMSHLSKEKEAATSTKLELLSHVDKLSEERRTQLAQFEELKSSFHEVEKGFFEINTLAADVIEKDVELLNNLRASMGSNPKQMGSDLQLVGAFGKKINESSRKKSFLGAASWWESMKSDPSSDAVGKDIVHGLDQLKSDVGNLKERISRHSSFLQEEAELLINDVSNLRREVVSQKESLESMMHEYARLESTGKEKDTEISAMRRSISLLIEACAGTVMEIESVKAQMLGNVSTVRDAGTTLKYLALAGGGTSFTIDTPSEELVKDLANRLLFAIKDFSDMQTIGGHHEELRSTISNLQKELQEKDGQNERIHAELVGQIKKAEAAASTYAQDLEYTKKQLLDSVNRLKMMEEERRLLEQRLLDMQQKQAISIDLQQNVKSLTDALAAKEQEAEALMQVLEEDENQMEDLKSKIQEMEEVVQKKILDLQKMESSRAKTMKKLSVTVTKFDELHHMSEGLLSEIENLQSQLQERDSEISFLRQEVTRCTNDVLLASKMTKERSSTELHEMLTWLDSMCSRVFMRQVQIGDSNSQGHECKERLQKDITAMASELESLRVVVQSKDALLNSERGRIEELLLRKEALEASLRQKETEQSVRAGDAVSEIVEVEPLIKKWSAPVTSTASQVRSLRKANNDHVISIDAGVGGTGRLQDEEDDKVHGFKSLTTSRFVPKFTRPVSDMVDGLWVSCDRALMRQPAFRLGIMIYWVMLHGLLAAFVV